MIQINEETKEKLCETFLYFGKAVQIKKLAEECREFLELYEKTDGREYDPSEIADVLALCLQFFITDEVIPSILDMKIERTVRRIHNGEYDNKTGCLK